MSSSVLLTAPGPLTQLLSCESFYGETCKSPHSSSVATIKRVFGVLTNPRLPVKKTRKNEGRACFDPPSMAFCSFAHQNRHLKARKKQRGRQDVERTKSQMKLILQLIFPITYGRLRITAIVLPILHGLHHDVSWMLSLAIFFT